MMKMKGKRGDCDMKFVRFVSYDININVKMFILYIYIYYYYSIFNCICVCEKGDIKNIYDRDY